MSKTAMAACIRAGIMEREVKSYTGSSKTTAPLGELDHPDSSIINLANVSHMITEVWMDGDPPSWASAKFSILLPDKILRALVESGVKIGISSRGYGLRKGADGQDHCRR